MRLRDSGYGLGRVRVETVNWNSLAIGPDGCLRVIWDEELLAGGVGGVQSLDRLQQQFAISTAAGLVDLLQPHWPAGLPASLAYWRDWVRLFFRTLCYADVLPGAGWAELPCPDEAELDSLVGAALR